MTPMLISGVKLCVIVPITKMAGRLEPLKTWLPEAVESEMGVLLIHDIRDEETSFELHELMRETQYSKVQLVEQEFGDQGTARNFGILHTSSEWVVFWDADDVPEPRSVMRAVDNANQEIDLIVGQYRINNQETKILGGKPTYRWNDLPRSLGLWRMAFRREALGVAQFPAIRMAEDQIFFVRTITSIRKIEFSPELFYTYTVGGSNQITRNKDALKVLPLAISMMFHEFKKIRRIRNRRFVLNLLLRLISTNFKRNYFWKFHASK